MRIHLAIYTLTYAYTYQYTHLHTHTLTYIHTYIRIHLPKYTLTYAYTYLYTHLHTYLHTYIRIFLPIYTLTYIPTHLHKFFNLFNLYVTYAYCLWQYINMYVHAVTEYAMQILLTIAHWCQQAYASVCVYVCVLLYSSQAIWNLVHNNWFFTNTCKSMLLYVCMYECICV